MTIGSGYFPPYETEDLPQIVAPTPFLRDQGHASSDNLFVNKVVDHSIALPCSLLDRSLIGDESKRADINAVPHGMSDSATIVIRGLPQGTTEENLLSLMAWSYHLLDARLLVEDSTQGLGLATAVFRFSDHSTAAIAMNIFNGKPNINASAIMVVEFVHNDYLASSQFASPAEENSTTRQRHKWKDEHVEFLKSKFMENPKPSTQAKKELAKQLGVQEKHVQTWFNNARQRLKNEGEF
jgi:RNA recognition motif-containing protein